MLFCGFGTETPAFLKIVVSNGHGQDNYARADQTEYYYDPQRRQQQYHNYGLMFLGKLKNLVLHSAGLPAKSTSRN